MTSFILAIFIGCFLVQISVWCLVLRRAASYNFENKIPNEINEIFPPVSVLICARNEALNLKNFLPKILTQNYPNFEVIVVDDASTDATAEVLENFKAQFAHLQIVRIIEKIKLGKKLALTTAVRTAKNDILLLTDADCVPATEDWIREMVLCTAQQKKIVLGISPYRPTTNSWLHTFIRHETTFTALQYVGFGLAGMPYMGVGRNVLYHKNLFEKVNGFSAHENIMAGDDDLFLNSVLMPNNFSIALNPSAFTYSLPKNTWKAYIKQKTRHISVSPNYKLIHQFLLGMFGISHLFFYFATFFCIKYKISTIFVLSIFVTRQAVLFIIYKQFAKRLGEKKLEATFLLFDAFLVLFNCMIALLFFRRFNNWK